MPLGCAEIGNVFLSIFARMAPWEWARTTDLTVNSRPLYQLSYQGILRLLGTT